MFLAVNPRKMKKNISNKECAFITIGYKEGKALVDPLSQLN